jgi:hypothetical protein
MARDTTAAEHEAAFQAAMDSETARLEFMRNRDGFDAMIEFAERGIMIYGQAINGGPKKPSMATTREHRYKFIASVFMYERLLGLDHTPPAAEVA